MIYGALPGEWSQLDLVLELTEDLLPVVSNPNAVPAPESSIKQPGKLPSIYRQDGHMVGIGKWTEKVSTSREVSRWANVPDYGICLQTRLVRAIDVDVDEPLEAGDIEATIQDYLRLSLPIRRRGNSSKFLLLFKMPGDFTKRRFKTAGGVIEFLAGGQQCVVSGVHVSGVRYEFDGGLPDYIPHLSDQQFENLWLHLNEKFGIEASVESRKGVAPAKPRTMDDVKDPLVYFLESEGWVLGYHRSGRVDIRCPWQDEHSSDTGDTATSYYPAGVGGFDRGHYKCLHAHCMNRTDGEFKDAIGWSIEGFEEIDDFTPATIDQDGNVISEIDVAKAPIPDEINTHRLTNEKSKQSWIPVNYTTVYLAMKYPAVCGMYIRYDAFRAELTRAKAGRWQPFSDEDYVHIQRNIETSMAPYQKIPMEMCKACVKTYAKDAEIDTAAEWIRSLCWDGTPRVARFLTEYIGAEDSPYTQAVSKYFWSAMAGRMVSPGVKADMAPIAVGKQGARKTTLLSAIPPERDMFFELDMSKDDDDIARELRGKILGELSELKGIGQKANDHIKSFMSRQIEEHIPKYGEYAVRYARRCIFFGTTNDDEPLPPDSTGQRRWLPFKVIDGVKCGVEQFIELREQFFAEALCLFLQHGVMWQDAERLATVEHPTYEKSDPWEDAIHEFLFEGSMEKPPAADWPQGVRIGDILTEVLNIHLRDHSRPHMLRVGDILRKAGMKKTPRGGKKVWVRA